MTATPDNYARDNAAAWLSIICEFVANHRAAVEDDAIDAAQTAIHEAPLSVEVRTDWFMPGQTRKAVEYQVLLSWGGPSVRITGRLNAYDEPDTARLEYQDWGTPWTPYPLTDEEREDVLTFAQQFHYGE